jgi:hypothetical protein
MARSSQAQKATRLNAAYRLLAQGMSIAEAAATLSREGAISRRQAYRYLQQASQLKGPAAIVRLRPSWLVSVLWAGVLASSAGALRYAGSVSSTPHAGIGHDPHGFVVVELTVYITFATVGAVVAHRRPRHPIGWMFLVAGLLFCLAELGHAYGHHALLAGEGSSLGEWAVWLSLAAFVPAFFAMVFFLPLVLPDGRLPSPRWRAVAWLGGVVIASQTLAEVLRPGPISSFPEVNNPAGAGFAAPFVEILGASEMLLPLLLVSAIVALVTRFVRASGPTRQQLKWVGFFAALLLAFIPLNEFVFRGADGFLGLLGGAMFVLAFSGLPVGIAIAVLRYRLYDIDRIISRTVAYALILGVLAASYAGLVVGLQQLTRPLTGGTDLAVAASTLAVAAAFRPVSRRIRDLVDRRFNRSRYDAQRTIDEYTTRLRNELDLDLMASELQEVVRRTMQPERVGVWIRPTTGDRV